MFFVKQSCLGFFTCEECFSWYIKTGSDHKFPRSCDIYVRNMWRMRSYFSQLWIMGSYSSQVGRIGSGKN